jgi:hypothetical protein
VWPSVLLGPRLWPTLVTLAGIAGAPLSLLVRRRLVTCHVIPTGV